jgi:ABC-type branched-subunit amino acid transport system substrate-binding protein
MDDYGSFLVAFSVVSLGIIVLIAKERSTVSVTLMNNQIFPPTEFIQVFKTARPDESYIEIAELTIKDSNGSKSMNRIIAKAKELGADGVIIIGSAGESGGAVPIGNIIYMESGSYGIKAIAIKYK